MTDSSLNTDIIKDREVEGLICVQGYKGHHRVHSKNARTSKHLWCPKTSMESLAILLAWLTQGSRSHPWPPRCRLPTPLFHKGRTHNRDLMQAVVLRVQLSHSLVQGLKFKRSLSKNSFMKLFGAECDHSTAIYSVYVACQCSAVYEYRSLKAHRCCYGGQKILIPVCPLLDIMKLRLSLFFEVNEIEL